MTPRRDVDLGRRAILLASLSAGGGLVLSSIPLPLDAAPADRDQKVSEFVPNAFIRVNRSGSVTAFMPYVEMGQGAYTSQTMVVAEELDVPLSSVMIEPAPADEQRYANPELGGQITGGSLSMVGTWSTMRSAAAAARVMLVEAAARQWGVAPADCMAEAGTVVHKASGRKLGYGQLTEAAARLPVPLEPALKEKAAFKVIGKTVKRVDSPTKVNGGAKFGIDVRLPNMRYAAVSACPVFNGKLRAVDTTAALRVKGVRQIVKLDDAVAVVADSTWSAMKGLGQLKIDWDEGANGRLTTADLVARADAALVQPGLVFDNIGDVAAAERTASRRYEAVFRLPALAHAAIEPMNCTVHVRPDGADVWCGSQVVGRARQVTAAATGLPLEKVKVHNHLLGGGFGRRLETDYVSQAAMIARQVSGPVKVTWTRAEDFQHDYYRGHNHSRVTVALDANGMPLSWRHRLAAPNIMARFLPANQKDSVDLDAVHDAFGPYDIPNRRIEFTRHEAPKGMNTGNWRGVGPTRNLFIVESVMDDLALQAGMDPIAYRRALMHKASPRQLHVLDLAQAKSGWGTSLPPRSGRGVAVFEAFGSYLAIIARVKVAPSGEIRVEHVTCAIDPGIAVNPDIVRAQIEGGVMFGISAALHERVVVADGRVQQANYDSYPVLRMREAPRVEVVIVDSAEKPGGVGEPGTSGVIAAVANAVRAATGVRSFSLPLDPINFKATS
jgi:isoquinoline 1-oxidoreductase subunit beta